jgi:hypothetical protein
MVASTTVEARALYHGHSADSRKNRTYYVLEPRFTTVTSLSSQKYGVWLGTL